ncbi:MAG: ATP-binding protein [Deltaproteobacteria bacterium]|nr:ATP-binding protein [Deltaproteobacteria bacterium]
MFNRKIEAELHNWKNKQRRKPLIIRGARQTGKTTLIRKFARQFKNFVELNLEKDSTSKIFANIRDAKETIQSIEGIVNRRIIPGETLLFLDEIQNSISAIKMLRYFYEEMPGLHIISAGSLLEVRMKKEGWSFPVGRVEFLYLYPVSFYEFLSAIGEDIILGSVLKCDLNFPLLKPLHDKLLSLLADYMFVGGMPEAVNQYISDRNLLSVRKYHGTLFSSFKEDFAKYSSTSEVEYLKLVWDKLPFETGKRIKYSKLAGSSAKSRDISKAFDILHEAMLVERIFPTTCTMPPLIKKEKSAPKSIFLDIGLCTYVANLTKDQISERLMSPMFGGGLFEEFVGQEFLADDSSNRKSFYFWVREEKGTSSELDFLLQSGEEIVPVEIKSGSHGSLKSLHQFLARSSRNLGVRIWSGQLMKENHKVILHNGKSLQYELLSLPFYLVPRLKEFVLLHG